MDANKKKENKKSRSSLRLFYAEYVQGRILTAVVILAIMALVALYFLGILPENIAGLLLAITVVLLACGFATFELISSSKSNVTLGFLIVLSLLALSLSLNPVISTLIPGHPAYQGVIRMAGQTMHLPDKLQGNVRMLLHGNLGLTSTSSVDVAFDIGDQRIEGHLDRVQKMARLGRRGRGRITEEHNSQFLSGFIPKGVHLLSIADLRGSVSEGLQVSIFKEWIPFFDEGIAAAVLVLFVAIIAGRMRASISTCALLASSMVFGMAIYKMATPFSVLSPELGALILSAIIGTSAGGTLGWIGQKLFGPRKASR